jgi:cysteinyl-tRNA synthetase
VDSLPGYGKLSGRTDQDAVLSGNRVQLRSEKRNPSDFALWKKAEPGHMMQWHSPWGSGFPGWHVECSAMATKYLGPTIYIHGGGMENKFPHHDCEIAQSEAASGKPFVRYWMHNNMVTVNGTKMGKSLKNSVNLKDLFKRVDPVVIRFFILQSHYRSPLDYSETAIRASQTGLEKLHDTMRRLLQALPGSGELNISAFIDRFESAMNDDFNTPIAISVLFDFSKSLNSALDQECGLSETALDNAKRFLGMYGTTLLGIIPPEAQPLTTGMENGEKTLDEVISILLDMRKEAREQKNYPLSDTIRDRLLEAGIEVKDTKDGASWSKVSNR